MLCTVPAIKLGFFCIESTVSHPSFSRMGMAFCRHVCVYSCVGVDVYGGWTPTVRTVSRSPTVFQEARSLSQSRARPYGQTTTLPRQITASVL